MSEQSMSNWRVLIVDDEPDNVEVVRKLLDYNGAEVYVARNGEEGLALLQDITPTLILLDISMPQMDGMEMFKRVRAHKKFANTAIIALTAHAMSEDRERILAAGFDAYIAKPFHITQLLEAIKVCLNNFSPPV